MRGNSGAVHPLLAAPVVREIERVVSDHLGRRWTASSFTDLDDRASHPCGLLRGQPFSVFAKLHTEADGVRRCVAELRGLDLLRRLAGVTTPEAVGAGTVPVPAGTVLLLEAVPETPPERRSAGDWRAIGQALARLHRVHDERFGLTPRPSSPERPSPAPDGYFGPLPQDNRPVDENGWAEFYARRRLEPLLRYAVDGGHLPQALARGVERIVARLPEVCGPDPRPALLHGDAQQNNILTGPTGPVLLDPAPYFGHPEVDLAFVDLFQPVPVDVFDGYRELVPIEPGFAQRRELWRLAGYLAVMAVDGGSPFGRSFLPRVADTVARYG
ncbi:fructosamine kinase family protein [Rugosimonospora africana]|uniref:Fructosamine kinase family protein n=1 Tax=Rugosimonospora africana TaxID=556532 RepID=A0A8J3QRE8_9ACTN|nr:fructosamine kinase family protein [Rugosimonospora africana]GIH14138.1 fructosamine kinase family protein [Rugosimonospora africana]